MFGITWGISGTVVASQRVTMRLTTSLLAISLAACAADPYPDDSAADTEVTDGKADGWLGSVAPQGTYLAADAGAGQFTKMIVKTDKSYERDSVVECIAAPCNPVAQTGKYKITHGGGTDYLRFLDGSGKLVDRYAFEIHGRQLRVRKVGSTDWQDLMIDDHKGSVKSAFAGIYEDYTAEWTDGLVFELQLEDTGQFYASVRGEIGCTRPGHDCPASYTDGPTGWTDLFGTWSETGGVATLVPTDDNTGATSPPIAVNLARTGASLAVTGSIGPTTLIGPMDVKALFNAAHSATDAKLDGTWTFTSDNRTKDNDVSNVEGYSEVINGATHMLTFDSTISEAVETSPNVNVGEHHFQYQVAGDPTGGARGVIYFKDGTEHACLKIKSVSKTRLVLRSDNDMFDYVLTKN